MNKWIEDPLFVSSVAMLKADVPLIEINELLGSPGVTDMATPFLAHQSFWRLVAHRYPLLFDELPRAEDIDKLGGMELTYLHALVCHPHTLPDLEMTEDLQRQLKPRVNWISHINGDQLLEKGKLYIVAEECQALYAFMNHMDWVGGATDYPFDVCLFREDYVAQLLTFHSEHELAHVIVHELLHCIQGQKSIRPFIGSYDELPLTIAVIEGCTETVARYASACFDDAASLEDINPGWLVLGLLSGCYQEQVHALVRRPAVADTTKFIKTIYSLGIQASDNASEAKTAALLNKYFPGAETISIDDWKHYFHDVGYDKDA